ncbi:MAG: PH domain-containing protein [Candidatus Odinarchaeia archaeon]
MNEDNLIYEDKIIISSWIKGIPFIIVGIILMFSLISLTIFFSGFLIMNIIFSILVGTVLIGVGIYFYYIYREMRYAVTDKEIIIEFGREKQKIPLNEITKIKRVKEMTFGEKFKTATENIEKVIIATIRDEDLIQIYQGGVLTAIITPADTEDFLSAYKIGLEQMEEKTKNT